MVFAYGCGRVDFFVTREGGLEVRYGRMSAKIEYRSMSFAANAFKFLISMQAMRGYQEDIIMQIRWLISC